MTYTLHPDPEQIGTPLTFVIDPGGDIDAQIKSAVAACFEGKGEHWFCDGPLYTRASDTGKPVAIVASEANLPEDSVLAICCFIICCF